MSWVRMRGGTPPDIGACPNLQGMKVGFRLTLSCREDLNFFVAGVPGAYLPRIVEVRLRAISGEKVNLAPYMLLFAGLKKRVILYRFFFTQFLPILPNVRYLPILLSIFKGSGGGEVPTPILASLLRKI